MSAELVEELQDAVVELIDAERKQVRADIGIVRDASDSTREQLEHLKTAIQTLRDEDLAAELTSKLAELATSMVSIKKDIAAWEEYAEQIKSTIVDDVNARFGSVLGTLDLVDKRLHGMEIDIVEGDSQQLKSLAEKVLLVESAVGTVPALFSELETRVESDMASRDERMTGKLETDLQFALVNADLWKETAKNKLLGIDARLDESGELVAYLEQELAQATTDNKALLADFQKAINEKMQHLGGYKKGQTYHYGQCVCRDGATFFCVDEKTDVDPRETTDTPHWRLLSARGEKGDRGKDGQRGQRGEKGEIGTPGKDGVSFVGAEVKGSAIVLVSTDGEAHRLDIGKTVSDIVDAHLKTQAESASNARARP